MPKCRKCNKEITKGNLCEHCKAIRFGKIKKAGLVCSGAMVSLGALALAIITDGIIDNSSK